jgi:two-component system sensor histidine kinase CpxA
VLRNAARYAGDAGPIDVTARAKGKDVTLEIADHGPGLPESEIEQVFEPFYRPEADRSRQSGGSGLGLAIVKSCVAACGGVVECFNRHPTGLVVRIVLQRPDKAPV